MSFQKLHKKALRELQASPKKAAMLALLAIVAAWFWAPLVLKSHAHSTPASPSAAATPAPVAVPSAVRAAIPVAPGNELLSWRDAAAAIDRDPRMAPAALAGLAQERNPFSPLVTVAERDQASAANEKQPDEDAEVEKPEVGPDDLGLVLSSTLVGRSRRAALISGRTYELGSKINVEGETFRLVEVEPSRIVLERDGRQYSMSIKRRDGGGRIELRPATP